MTIKNQMTTKIILTKENRNPQHKEFTNKIICKSNQIKKKLIRNNKMIQIRKKEVKFQDQIEIINHQEQTI